MQTGNGKGKERDREREKKRRSIYSEREFLAKSEMQTCLPKNTFVSTPNSLCPYFQMFDRMFADAPPINQNKKVSKHNFSIIHLVKTLNSHFQLYRHTTKLAHYDTRMPLFV